MSSTVEETDAGEDVEVEPSSGGEEASEVEEGAAKDSGAHRVAWSDNEDSDDAYAKFKKRKTLQRRQQNEAKRQSKRRSSPNDAAASGMIRSTKRRRTGTHRGAASRMEDQPGREDNDASMPVYLKQRKTQFDTRRQKLQAGGLRLPPSYDDVAFSDDERIAELKECPAFVRTKPVQPYRDRELPYSLGVIPAPIAQWLRDYQIEGVAFLHRLFVYQTGGILGDDMGLGKTVQVIAFLTVAFGKTGDERDRKRMRKLRRAGVDWYPRVLVVCPGTLIENWKDEFERWGWWHVDVYHGSTRDEVLQAATAGRLEVLITTYTTYRNHRSALNCVNWDCVIADECHHIKGKDSETAKAMNEVNALCRIGLTGTAIQNSYEELWVLLNWAIPGRFGTISDWKHTISEPLRMGQSHEATLHQLGKARKIAKALVENLLPPYFLRRMKSLIADQLPKKSDRVIFCPMTETQTAAYTAFVESDVVQCIKKSSELCECGSNKKKGFCCEKYVPGGGNWQSYVFPAVINLQKLSNHLAILIPQGTDPIEKQEKDLVLLKAALPNDWKELYSTRGSILHFSNPAFCGKWKVLKKLLKFWHDAGDKVLVFSHSVRLLRMLRQLFQHTAYNVAYLDGSMSYTARAQAVADYNADPTQFVFLISTRAGGVGLNITAANKVVVVDPHWNPAWDLQAQDRAYRLGQVRDVDVFRLVSAGTIEEIVYARQVYKQQQANIGYTAAAERRYFAGVQHSESRKGEIFGLENLFAPPRGNGVSSVLEAIVHKTNVAEARAGVAVVDFDIDASTQDDSLPSNFTSQGVPSGSDADDPQLASTDDDPALAALAQLIAETPEDNASLNSQKSKGKAKAPPQRASSARSDPVQAILASAGVAYSHVNSEVVGTSRVEGQLSAAAEAAGNTIERGDKKLFQSSQPTVGEEDSDHEQLSPRGEEHVPHSRYRPPVNVRKRQFCTMAKTWGYDSAAAFALVVEGWTSGQRRAALDKFYALRKKELHAAGKLEADEDTMPEATVGSTVDTTAENGHDSTSDKGEEVPESDPEAQVDHGETEGVAGSGQPDPWTF